MRDIIEVIDKIIAAIPETEEVLIRSINSVRKSAMYCPPEGMVLMWKKLCWTLSNQMPEPPELDWEKKISSIICDKE